VRFDWFLELIEQGASGQALWDYFFDDALPHTEHQARARVRAALLLSEDCAGFDGDDDDDDDDDDDAAIEYKSMEGAPVRNGGMIGSHPSTPPAASLRINLACGQGTKAGRSRVSGEAALSLRPCRKPECPDEEMRCAQTRLLRVSASPREPKINPHPNAETLPKQSSLTRFAPPPPCNILRSNKLYLAERTMPWLSPAA
jgi:hypothetical protein